MATFNAELMHTGPRSLKKRGIYSSVSIYSSKNIAVLVYESTFGNLYYSVGEVKKDNFATEWRPAQKYNIERGGTSPSVAFIKVQDELYVIETHCSFQYLGRSGEIYNMMGKVNDDFEIEWEQEKFLCNGHKPKICAKDDGTVIITYEKKRSYSLLYNIGKMESGQTGIKWKEMGSVIPEVTGVTPDVAIHDNNIIFIYRYYATLKYKIATVESDGTTSWSNERSLEEKGKRPSISINCEGLVTIFYQYPLWGIYYFVGKLEKRADEFIIKRNETLLLCKGDYPSIALADDKHALTVHTSWGNLFTSQGELHLPKHE